MRRKKTEDTSDPAKFWPIPGVDGEPYPPLVQEALDLVAKETLRRKRAECTHENRVFITGASRDRYSPIRYRRACRDCHLVVRCEHPEHALTLVKSRYSRYSGGYVKASECRCGEIVARRAEPVRRTVIYGFDYERHEEPPRQTGTTWLKTEEQERQERRTDVHVARQVQRASERLPLTLSVDKVYSTKAGAFESALLKALERDLQEITERTKHHGEGALARSSEAYVLRKANGEAVIQVTGDDRAPDLSWVRTMNGRKQL